MRPAAEIVLGTRRGELIAAYLGRTKYGKVDARVDGDICNTLIVPNPGKGPTLA